MSERSVFYATSNGLIEYNEVDRASLLGFQDSTAVYTAGVDNANTTVRYNWVHDIVPYVNNPTATFGYGIGFRVDDGGEPINIHNNVVSNVGGTGILLKGDDHRVYNNTVLNVGGALGNVGAIIMVDGGQPGDINANSEVYNNIALEITSQWNGAPYVASTSVGTNFTGADGSTELVDPANLDFTPKAGSALIDAGTHLPGYTDGFLGMAPDIGAIEFVALGDMNGNGLVNLGDVAPFIQALVDRAAYDAQMYGVNADITGDIDGSGTFDTGDIEALPALFGGTATARSDTQYTAGQVTDPPWRASSATQLLGEPAVAPNAAADSSSVDEFVLDEFIRDESIHNSALLLGPSARTDRSSPSDKRVTDATSDALLDDGDAVPEQFTSELNAI